MSNIIKKDDSTDIFADILADAEKLLGKPIEVNTKLAPRPELQTVFILIDCSGSMAGSNIGQATKGALGFAEEAISKRYKVGIISFNSSAYLVCEAGSLYRDIGAKLEHLSANGSTNMTAAIEIAVEKLNAVSGTKAICVVTDGVPDNPTSTLKIADYAKSLGIGIMTIGTDDADASFLAKLASQSNLTSKVESKDLEKAITNMARLLPS